jgi:uncharacterized protein (TIGR02453 family)
MHLRDLTQFLKELGENNNRPWFIMNKPRYDILREEFLELVTALIKEIGKFDPLVAHSNPKKAMFRINRDVRFANDKSPYKAHFSAAIAPNDLRRPSVAGGPTYYLRINGKGQLMFGAGEHMPPAPRLRAIRELMVEDAAGFSKVLKNKRLVAAYGGIEEDAARLQRPPKGFAADEPHIEYIKMKSFFVWKEVPLKLNAPDELLPQLVAGMKDALPMVAWLRSAKVAPEEE